MAKRLQLRRGTTSQHSAFTGAIGEVTVDTDKKVVVVHDGSTVGGIAMAKDSVKVDKVTATDNAIVRFDGTNGQVQNSGVTIDDSGNVGISVTPSAWINEKAIQVGIAGSLSANNNTTPTINTSSNVYMDGSWVPRYIVSVPASRVAQYNGSHTWYTAPSGTAGNPITWTIAMTLGSNGNLLVGTTTDNGVDKLQVNGSIRSDMAKINCTESIYNNAVLKLFFERASKKGIVISVDSSASTGVIHFVNGATNNGVSGTQVGSIETNGSSTSYNTSSDYRLKKNIRKIENSIEKVKSLKPVTFDWILDDATIDGFIAHELQDIVPNAVTGKKDGEEMQSIDTSKIIALLTSALQESIQRIEIIENNLKGKQNGN